MAKLLEQFNKSQLKKLPEITTGDIIKVHQKVKEGGKDLPAGRQGKIQIFEGLVIAKKHGKGISATITVRKIAGGVGVERIFPIHSLLIDKIEVLRHGKTRRAKLYYLRTAKGKKSKLKNKEFAEVIADEPEESPAEEPAENSEDNQAGEMPAETEQEKTE